MHLSAVLAPVTDPTPIFELIRGSYGTELLAAGVCHFGIIQKLADRSQTVAEIRDELKLAERPAVVLFTALRAMRLLQADDSGRLQLTDLAREHLIAGGHFDVTDYIGLHAGSPGVSEMIARLTTNRPANADKDEGAAFIFRAGETSAMEREASARHLTLALAGRAKNVAPHLAKEARLAGCRKLLDVGGGTGIYSIACLQRYPGLRAVVWDRPEVLKVAHEFAVSYDVVDRLECLPGDMFVDPVPADVDCILLSNILHDWDVPECQQLISRAAAALPSGGKLLIHDVFLNDAHDGPLPVALYSAALFSLTEGRAYSAGEYRQWLQAAGLKVGEVAPTLVHCGILQGEKA